MNFSNIFRYRFICDASGCHTNCPHSIGKYIWNFGDGSSVETELPKITHYFMNRGHYNVTLTIVATCPRTPPNTASVTKTVSVGLSDMALIKPILKNKEKIIEFVIRMAIQHELDSISESPDNGCETATPPQKLGDRMF